MLHGLKYPGSCFLRVLMMPGFCFPRAPYSQGTMFLRFSGCRVLLFSRFLFPGSISPRFLFLFLFCFWLPIFLWPSVPRFLSPLWFYVPRAQSPTCSSLQSSISPQLPDYFVSHMSVEKTKNFKIPLYKGGARKIT